MLSVCTKEANHALSYAGEKSHERKSHLIFDGQITLLRVLLSSNSMETLPSGVLSGVFSALGNTSGL